MNPFDQPEFARALFDENGDALFLVDPDADTVLAANRTATRLTGFRAGELVGGSATGLFRFEPGTGDLGLRSAAESTALFHGKGGFQLRTRTPPGWLPVTMTVARLHVRPKTLALYTARDDSDRRAALARANQAEAEVRQREAWFRALVEKANEGILVIDARGTITYLSPGNRRLLGHDPAVWTGRNGFELVHPDDRVAVRAALAEAVAHPDRDVTATFRASHEDGGWRSIEVNGVNRLADPTVRGVVLNYRDVTDRVRTEAALRRQNDLLHALFDSVPDVVCVKDRELRYLAGNAAFERLVGRPVSELIGRRCGDAFPPAVAERWEATEAGVVLTGRPVQYEEWVRYPDGRSALHDVLIGPMWAEDGAPAGLVVVGRDVTEHRRLEEQLRHAQKMDAVGQLAGGVAHDFNNLLTVILGNVELARTECRGRRVDELLRGIEKGAKRAAELTGQLLGFARRQPMQFRAVDPADAVRETVALLQRTIDPRIVIETAAAGGTAVWADPGQLNQVLVNLCLNARDAMPDGGTLSVEAAEATVSVADAAGNLDARPGRYVRLRVRDTGAGMSPEVRARIFEPFFTTKATGQGTGLGLAVVFGIVQAHGGWIDCQSEPGAGTTFDVYLPRHAGPAAASGTPAAIPSPFGRGEWVLVADDEPMIRDLARVVLEQLEYRVVVAADGAEAVNQFRAAGGKFDLVVLDLTMPTLSGRDALAELRRQHPHVRVLLASGYSADREELSGAVAGFLDKPYTPGDLARAVRAALDGGAG